MEMASSGGVSLVWFFVPLLVLIATPVALLPTIIAFKRGHPKKAAITVINVFLGWTLAGWVVALIMSVSDPNPRQQTPQNIVVNQNVVNHPKE